ncbi:MAG: hypothetical protein ACHQM6_10145, partial [Candidatus Kapaibacterium sp.]
QMQVVFPGGPNPRGFGLPVYIRPCFLAAPGDPPPQGATMYSRITPSPTGDPTATAVRADNGNAGITIGVTNAGSGGPGEA